MKAKVNKWGNSLAIRISKAFALQIGIYENSNVNLSVDGDRIIISKPKVSLKELMQNVTIENTHASLETGKNLGKEIW